MRGLIEIRKMKIKFFKEMKNENTKWQISLKSKNEKKILKEMKNENTKWQNSLKLGLDNLPNPQTPKYENKMMKEMKNENTKWEISLKLEKCIILNKLFF